MIKIRKAPQPPVPQELSFAQLIAGLVAEAWITKAEGKAWLRGTLPAQVTAMIAALPEAQQMLAEARALRPTSVVRGDPIVLAMAAQRGNTAEQMDDFFRKYGAL